MDQEQFSILKAELLGDCLKCGQPAMGSFDCDENSDDGRGYDLTVECVSCHQVYELRLDSEHVWAWQREAR